MMIIMFNTYVAPSPPLTSFAQPRYDEECLELEYLMQIASGGGRVVGYCGMRSEVTTRSRRVTTRSRKVTTRVNWE